VSKKESAEPGLSAAEQAHGRVEGSRELARATSEGAAVSGNVAWVVDALTTRQPADIAAGGAVAAAAASGAGGAGAGADEALVISAGTGCTACAPQASRCCSSPVAASEGSTSPHMGSCSSVGDTWGPYVAAGADTGSEAVGDGATGIAEAAASAAQSRHCESEHAVRRGDDLEPVQQLPAWTVQPADENRSSCRRLRSGAVVNHRFTYGCCREALYRRTPLLKLYSSNDCPRCSCEAVWWLRDVAWRVAKKSLLFVRAVVPSLCRNEGARVDCPLPASSPESP